MCYNPAMAGSEGSPRNLGHGLTSLLRRAVRRTELKEPAQTTQVRGTVLTARIHNLDEFLSHELQAGVTTIRDYLDPITACAGRYEGLHEGYRGENYLQLSFGTYPFHAVPEHERLAVEAALAMRSLLGNLNATRARKKEPVLRIGFGIDSGNFLYGNFVGRNLASTFARGESRTISKEIARLSADLDYDILIGERTNEELGNLVETREVEQFKSETNLLVKVYAVIGPYSDKLT